MKMSKSVKKSVGKAEKHERQRRGLELRKAGMTYAQIATSLGVSESASYRLVKSALEKIVSEPTDDLRKIMDERYNSMLMVTWPGVQGGDGASIDRAMRIMDRQAALRGLNAPQEITVNANTKHVLELGGSIDDYRESLREYRIAALEGGGDTVEVEGGNSTGEGSNGPIIDV